MKNKIKKCKEKCGGIIVMKNDNDIPERQRKFVCNKCGREYFVYRNKRKNQRCEV